MRRLFLALVLALVGGIGFGSLAPALPAAHAAAIPPSVGMLAGTVQVGATGVVTGRNYTPNNWAYVYFQRPDGTTNAVFAQTSASGMFSVTLGFSTAHGTGNEYITAYDYGTARWSPTIIVAVISGTPAPVRQITVSGSTVAAGATLTVSGQSFTANNWVYVYFQRPNGTSGAFWVQTGAGGAFSSPLGFDVSNGCGTETIWAYDYGTQLWSSPGTVTVTGCSSVAAPSNLQVTSVTTSLSAPQQTTVGLHWQDNSSTETGFRIRASFTRMYGGTDAQEWTVGPNANTANASFVSGGINPVSKACFTVTAFDSAGESAPSNQVCAQL
jgi:hypothetical protein